MQKAVEAVLDEIAPAVIGISADDQRLVDQALVDLDGTLGKSRLGANAILGVSLAVAKAAAESADLPLFRYLGGPNAHILPVPMMNILNGRRSRRHGGRRPRVRGRPDQGPSFKEALRWGAEVYHALKAVLKKQGLNTGLGDEGGFAPDVAGTRAALDLICSAIESAGFTPAGTSHWPSTSRPPSSSPKVPVTASRNRSVRPRRWASSISAC